MSVKRKDGCLGELHQLSSDHHHVDLARRYIMRMFQPGEKLEILEAGCGQHWELDLGDADYRLTGVDLDAEALRIRKDVRGDLHEAILADLSIADLESEQFDVIYNSFVLEHVVRVDNVLTNFAKWMKPGGILILRFPDPDSVRGFVTRRSPHLIHVLYYRHILHYREAGRPGFPPYPTIYHPLVSRLGIRDFCAQNGLVIREEWGDGQHLLLGNGLIGAVSKIIMSLVGLLSFRRLSADHTNLLYIIEKPDQSHLPPPSEPPRAIVRPNTR